MGILEEIERGTLNRLLTTPVFRSAIMNALVAEQAISTAVQVLAIMLLGLLAGADYPGGVAGLVVLLVAALLLLPLTFLSSAFMAESLMPSWMRAIADANPVNWALDAARAAIRTGTSSPSAADGWRWRPPRWCSCPPVRSGHTRSRCDPQRARTSTRRTRSWAVNGLGR